jgi:hypothetical protein
VSDEGPRADGDGADEPQQKEREKEHGRQQLEAGLIRSGLTYQELWWRQVAVGGNASPLELEAYLLGLLELDPHQHDLIAQALNEHFLDLGQDHPMPYSEPGSTGSPWD